ncbi:hypothetical protein BD779DRAFT_1677786 [Infundibulicybe gibba]|nr:hypothetical protein BD779DRAFT_1677786 [Infundibulicybe gibba]
MLPPPPTNNSSDDEDDTYVSTQDLATPYFFRVNRATTRAGVVVIPGKYYCGFHNHSGKLIIGAAVEIRGQAMSTEEAKATRETSHRAWTCLLLFKGRHSVCDQDRFDEIIHDQEIAPIPDKGGREIFATMSWEWVKLNTIQGPIANIAFVPPNGPLDNFPEDSLFCRYVVNDSRIGVEMWSVLLPNGNPAWLCQVNDLMCAKLTAWRSPNTVMTRMRKINPDQDIHPETPEVIRETLENEGEEELPEDPEGMRDLEGYEYSQWVLLEELVEHADETQSQTPVGRQLRSSSRRYVANQ